MQTLNKKALTERICENFAGHKEVFMADVGNFLRKEHIDYKELGYKKLRDLMLALESFTLEDRFADPDSPPYTVVFLPEKREEKAQGQRTAHDEAALSKARQGILQHFAGQQTVLMADVGNFLRACQVDYKAMGYGKLKLFMEAMEGFVLEDTYPVPGAAAATLSSPTRANLLDWFKGNDRPPAPAGKALEFTKPERWQNSLSLTPEDKVTGYNNFYEFGLDKADPAANAGSLKTDPWTLTISGEVNKPLTLDHDALTTRFPLEERIYRMRCVEAWSMVVPWVGFPLHKLLALVEPTSHAKYVAFETRYAPDEMPGQKDRFIGGGLKYPYVEGLRLDEAMHPLTLLTVGVYGKALPPQNGAPIRLTVPWKYGFKGIKSIVSIKLTREQPPTTWNMSAPNEYGFYANVNPQVDHPRWSQATERFIGSGGILDVQRQPTLPFNGYADEVASLYQGMDLREYF